MSDTKTEAKSIPAPLVEAIRYAFNVIPNKTLPSCPHGYRDTYAIAAALDRHFRGNA